MTATPHANAPQKQASDPRQSAWVNANAGAGKTHVLVDRVIRLVLAGTPPSRILCLTFTKAAAAEMTGRIFERLAGWIALDDRTLAAQLENLGCENIDPELLLKARQLFAATQETPGGLKIQTIHAFCERLLQLFPVEAGMAPGFAVLDDATAMELRDACRDSVITEAVQAPASALGAALSRVTGLVAQEAFDELIQHLLSISDTWYAADNPAAAVLEIGDHLSRYLGVGSFAERDTLLSSLNADAVRYRELYAALMKGGTNGQKTAQSLLSLLNAPEPTLLDARDFHYTSAGTLRKYGKFPADEVKLAIPGIVAFLEDDQVRLDSALKRIGDIDCVAGTQALLTICTEILKRYEDRKRRRGQYDFGDLINRTRNLLAARPDAAWVLYKLDGGIDHVLIDEAQDTSPVQWEIVTSLTGEFFAGAGSRPNLTRTMFAVGDRKQSIFSFQGADPSAFEAARQHFKEQIEGAGQRLNDVNFTLSFRSTPEILKAVDAVFADAAPARRGLEGWSNEDILHESNRPRERGLVEIWPLIESEGGGEPEPWTAPVDKLPENAPARILARKIAAAVKDWIGNRFIGDSRRIVTAGDILILVRRRNAFFDAMISELRRGGVPVAGADRLKLHESLAVLDFLALASFALMPEDDYSLACILKSPLFDEPLTEDELFSLCHARGSASLWQVLRNGSEPKYRAAALDLEHWISQAATVPPFEFFASVVQARRTAFVARLGTEANDPLNEFLQAALDHGGNRAPSLSAFLTWFKQAEIEIKRNMEQARDEVRVMTAHGAKGLEAPIVILPDTTALPVARGARQQIIALPIGNDRRKIPMWAVPKARDSEKMNELKELAKTATLEEYHRLLYVAMTRARDELYIGGYRGKHKPPDGNWYQRVKDEVLKLDGVRQLDDAGWRYGVDPAPAEAEFPAVPWRTALPPWISKPFETASAGNRASITALAGGHPQGSPADADALARGGLVHRLLQVLPEVPEEERQALARHIARRSGQPESVADRVLELLAHDVLAPVLRQDGMSEVALSAALPEFGTAVTGRIDRLIVSNEQVTIADYKTDRNWPTDLENVPASYARQMALYRKVMENAYPGRKIRCILVWTSAPSVMELPSSFLDRALARLMAARP